MIDLHAHLLPGIDDGPQDMEESLSMARIAADTGTTQIVATPHVREDYPDVRIEELAERVADLNRALARAGIDLNVLSGAEVDLLAALELPEHQLRAATLGANGSDVLIETPMGPLPSSFEGLLDQVRDRGFRIVLAHPELNASLVRDPERLGRLVETGVLVQITARSLRPAKGSASRSLAFSAVERGWAHALASDGHSSTWRPPSLGTEVAAAAQRQPGFAQRLAWMTEDAPGAILTGVEIPAPPAAVASGGRLVGALGRSSRWLRNPRGGH